MYKALLAILILIAVIVWGVVFATLQEQQRIARVEARILIMCVLQSRWTCDTEYVTENHWQAALNCSETTERFAESDFNTCMIASGVEMLPKP